MYDLLTTAAVVDELSGSLTPGRVQRVGLRDPQTVAIELYTARHRQHLVATIGDPEPALYRSPDPFASDPGLITPFGLLLRKYVRGATFSGMEQLPLERIIRLQFTKRFWRHNRDDDEVEQDNDLDGDASSLASDIVQVALYVELMGRRSNVILVDDHDRVMDSLKRVTPKMSRVRPIWPSARYEPPPARAGLDPRSATVGLVTHMLESQPRGASLSRALIEHMQGFSPAMADEAAWRAVGSDEATVDDVDPLALQNAIRAIVEPLDTGIWDPRSYRDAFGDLTGYAAIPFETLQHEADESAASSISDAVAAGQRTGHSVAGRHDGRRNRLLARISQRRHQVLGRIRSIERQQASVAEADRLRKWGETIYAHLWEIEADQSVLAADGERVPLDPLRPPKDVAADYFETYRRMQRGLGEVEHQLDDAHVELEYLDQIETLASFASSFDEIQRVLAEWEAYAGSESSKPVRKRRPSEDNVRPITDVDGNLVYLGRSGPQNDRVTFDIAGPDDWWLHARGVPGSHVIVRGNGREPSPEALQRAASLAAYFSKSRTAGKVEVDIARRRDVRKVKGSGPGMVTYRNERTILVSPSDELSSEHG